jgi:hypothetical protein
VYKIDSYERATIMGITLEQGIEAGSWEAGKILHRLDVRRKLAVTGMNGAGVSAANKIILPLLHAIEQGMVLGQARDEARDALGVLEKAIDAWDTYPDYEALEKLQDAEADALQVARITADKYDVYLETMNYMIEMIN